MTKNIPIKLERDPIVEALFEIRFRASVSQVSTLLPGLMFSSLGEDFEAPERLAAFDFPAELIAAQPNLQYQPNFRIKSKSFVILLGDFSLIISCSKPYVGWDRFKEIILKLIKVLEGTKLISDVERFSVKYINLFPEADVAKQFQLLKLRTEMGIYNLMEHQTSIQTEIIEDNLNNLVEVRSNALITYPDGKQAAGILVSVDTICFQNKDFWVNAEQNIDKIHSKEKQIFYDLLTENAINACSPVWK